MHFNYINTLKIYVKFHIQIDVTELCFKFMLALLFNMFALTGEKEFPLLLKGITNHECGEQSSLAKKQNCLQIKLKLEIIIYQGRGYQRETILRKEHQEWLQIYIN